MQYRKLVFLPFIKCFKITIYTCSECSYKKAKQKGINFICNLTMFFPFFLQITVFTLVQIEFTSLQGFSLNCAFSTPCVFFCQFPSVLFRHQNMR